MATKAARSTKRNASPHKSTRRTKGPGTALAPLANDNLLNQPLMVSGSLQIEAKLGTDDLAELFNSEIEDRLREERASISRRKSQLTTDYNKLTATLSAAGKQLAENYTSPTAEKLAEALGEFVSTKYAVRIKAENVSVEKQQVAVNVAVSALEDLNRKPDRYGSTSAVFPRISETVQLPFTAEMLATIGKMATYRSLLAECEQQLTDVANQLADLPSVARRARAAMTKALLSGEQLNSAQLIERMSEVAKPLSLPSA